MVTVCLVMELLGVDCIAVKLPVLPPIPAFCRLFGDVNNHPHSAWASDFVHAYILSILLGSLNLFRPECPPPISS